MRLFKTSLIIAAVAHIPVCAEAAPVIFSADGHMFNTLSDTTCEVSRLENTQEIIDVLEIPSKATDPETGVTYTVTAIGYGAYSKCTNIGKVIIPNTVTLIDMQAFMYCGMSEVEIPQSVTTIEGQAFNNCPNLASVTLPSSVTRLYDNVFSDCTLLSEVNLSQNLKKLPAFAFENCTSLSSIVIPDAVETIGAGCFADCTSLSDVTLPKGLVTLSGSTFTGCSALTKIELPESTELIGACAFQNSNLSSIHIPAKVNQLSGAFADCEMLSSITVDSANPYLRIKDGSVYSADLKTLVVPLYGDTSSFAVPEGVTTLSSFCFAYNPRLQNVTLPSSLRTISYNAFTGCRSLENLNFPEGLESIGYAAFSGCSVLPTPAFPSTLKTIDHYAFDGCVAFKGLLTIPESVRTLNEAAFRGCTSLQYVNLLAKVDFVADNLFQACTALEQVNLPNTVGSIRIEAFSGCNSLKSLTLPAKVQTIGRAAFYGCTNLEVLTLLGSVPPGSTQTSPDYIFPPEMLANTTVRVPADAEQAYRGSVLWKEFGKLTGFEGLEVIPSTLTLDIGQTMQLSTVLVSLPTDVTYTYTWPTISDDVLRLDDKGLVTAISPGTRNIEVIATASDYSHYHGMATVTVIDNKTVGIDTILTDNPDDGPTIPATADEPSEPEYYTIDGLRVSNPRAGQLLIRRTGSRVEKVIIR